MLEYSIIPISFKDYNEYVDDLNNWGRDGWIFSTQIRTYHNSPVAGYTTHDYICYRKIVWWKAIYLKLKRYVS